jgi:hypothetical protein
MTTRMFEKFSSWLLLGVLVGCSTSAGGLDSESHFACSADVNCVHAGARSVCVAGVCQVPGAGDGGRTRSDPVSSDAGQGGPDGQSGCPGPGIAQGNAAISGVPSIDTFFASMLAFDAAARAVEDGTQTELDAIAVAVGLSAGASPASISAAIQAKLAANVHGTFVVKSGPTVCLQSARTAQESLVQCDPSLDRQTTLMQCAGRCVTEGAGTGPGHDGAGGEHLCQGGGGQICSGICAGDCSLALGARCEGTCQGSCSGECSVKSAGGDCNGWCDGICKGVCNVDSGGGCSGSCEGSCEYTSPAGGPCASGATTWSVANGSDSIACNTGCSGVLRPPAGRAECQASVEADAASTTACTVSGVDATFQLSPAVAAGGQAEIDFLAWVDDMKRRLTTDASGHGILSRRGQIELLVNTATEIAASETAIRDSIRSHPGGDPAALECALAELGPALALVSGAASRLGDSAQSLTSILQALGVSG